MIDQAAIRLRWDAVGSRLDERGRRLYLSSHHLDLTRTYLGAQTIRNHFAEEHLRWDYYAKNFLILVRLACLVVRYSERVNISTDLR